VDDDTGTAALRDLDAQEIVVPAAGAAMRSPKPALFVIVDKTPNRGRSGK
jgi:hypothetical protein